MSDFITLVLAKHDKHGKAYLFKAPRNAFINEGDKALVETTNGPKEVDVVGVKNYEHEDSDITKLLIAATNATLPLKKVLVFYRQTETEWPEEVTEENETNE